MRNLGLIAFAVGLASCHLLLGFGSSSQDRRAPEASLTDAPADRPADSPGDAPALVEHGSDQSSRDQRPKDGPRLERGKDAPRLDFKKDTFQPVKDAPRPDLKKDTFQPIKDAPRPDLKKDTYPPIKDAPKPDLKKDTYPPIKDAPKPDLKKDTFQPYKDQAKVCSSWNDWVCFGPSTWSCMPPCLCHAVCGAHILRCEARDGGTAYCTLDSNICQPTTGVYPGCALCSAAFFSQSGCRP